MRTHRLAHSPLLLACVGVAIVSSGCGGDSKEKAKPQLTSRYTAQPRRVVPEWLKGTILQEVDLAATAPYHVSNFGLVVMKRPTGDATKGVPNTVREYMLREMTKRGFGSQNEPGFETTTPDSVLRDPHVAIVRVDSFIPAGAVKGSRMDVQVTALEDSDTTSLAGGMLYTTDLFRDGANPMNPGGIDVLGSARGYVFVNPAYALEGVGDDASKRRSLTSGTVLAGGRVTKNRPFGLQIRAAERRVARETEQRIDQLCADSNAAKAEDEGMVFVNVPPRYRGDWEHFAGVVLHTYYSDDAGFAAAKARQLVEEVAKPDAILLDISYAWEALGRPSLSAIQPLYTDSRPDVAFAAARAGAWIGDASAEEALAGMARDPSNSLRVTAVKTLCALEPTPAVNALLHDLVSRQDTLVRIEAYRGLARNLDPSITSRDIGDKFKLDIVLSDGPPLIYATQSGTPRIAFLGNTARLASATFFTAMNNEFSITPVESRNNLLSIFYRGPSVKDPVKQLTTPDLAEIVARLGGLGPEGEAKLDFSYGEIVAILSKMADQNMLLSSRSGDGSKANFILQERSDVSRDIDSAPVIPEGPRPISDARQ